MATHEPQGAERDSHARFGQTQWSMVLAARHWPSPEAHAALDRLCQTYWYPLYAFLRRRGHRPPEAQDLTQSFFAHLLENETLSRVDERKGRFRTFLLASLGYFLQNERDKEQTLKRGGRFHLVAWDAVDAEALYRLELPQPASAESLFERNWAKSLVEQVLGKVRREYAASDKADVFTALEPCLTGETTPDACALTARRLQMSEGAVKVALHRLRRRFGEGLRAEIARTVAGPEEVDAEIRCLLAALNR